MQIVQYVNDTYIRVCKHILYIRTYLYTNMCVGKQSYIDISTVLCKY